MHEVCLMADEYMYAQRQNGLKSSFVRSMQVDCAVSWLPTWVSCIAFGKLRPISGHPIVLAHVGGMYFTFTSDDRGRSIIFVGH